MEQHYCQPEKIFAYLDDELDGVALAEFEAHLRQCSQCKLEVTDQQQLLGTLSSALNEQSELPLPRDFARVVAVVAESDMSGMRAPSEHRHALQICVVLALGAIALLGVAARTYFVNFVRAVGKPVSIGLDLVWTTVYDASAGVVVISRVISRGVVPETFVSAAIGLLLLGGALLLLSRLIASYHRTGLIK